MSELRAVVWHHSFPIWLAAAAARDRVAATAAATPGASLFDAVVAVILAASSTEAFINEIPESIETYRRMAPEMLPRIDPRFWALSDVLTELESSRGSLTAKYLMAAHVLGRPYDRGANPLQDFELLVTLRNEVMHLKPRDRVVEGENRIQFPRYATVLQQRGLLKHPPGSPVISSWFDEVQTPQLAEWACDTARAMVRSLLGALPRVQDRENPAGTGGLWVRD